MPRNKIQGIVYGLCICIVMVCFMSLYNITISKGHLNSDTIQTWIIILPSTFIIAYLIQNLFVSKIKDFLKTKFMKEDDSQNAHILFDAFCIVTIMSFVMTIIGDMMGGESLMEVITGFLGRWPTNFWLAMLINLFVAVPFGKVVLKMIQVKNSKTI